MSGNGYATLEDLTALSGYRKYRDVAIPNPMADNGTPLRFRIQTITEAEWSEISSGNFDVKRGGLSASGLQSSDARLVAACLVDTDGNRLLRGPDAIDKIRNLSACVVEPLVRACREHNNLRSGEDDEKNSPVVSDSDLS